MTAVRRSLSRSWQDYSFLWVVFSRQWTSYFFNIDWPRSAQDSWILYISGFSDRENLERKIMFHFSPLAATNKMWRYKYCWPPSHIKCTSTNTRDVFTKIPFWPTKAKKVLWSPQILGPLAGRFWVFVVWFFFLLYACTECKHDTTWLCLVTSGNLELFTHASSQIWKVSVWKVLMTKECLSRILCKGHSY